MADAWRPSDAHLQYSNDPSFIERRFGVQPLTEHLEANVCGVARLVILPSFHGEAIFTLIYREGEITLHSVIAEHSLWDSLSGGSWSPPTMMVRSLSPAHVPEPLDQWKGLKAAAKAAPSVHYAVINGRQYETEDGVSFRHQILDREDSISAEWHNPLPEASNHVSQMTLVDAYDLVINDDTLP